MDWFKALMGLFSGIGSAVEAAKEEDRLKVIAIYKRKHREAEDEIAALKKGTDEDLAAGKAELEKLKDNGPGGPTHI